MTEEEEFEFRRRLEAEQQAAAPVPVERAAPNELQRRMGARRPVPTEAEKEAVLGNVGESLLNVGYDAGGAVTDYTGSPALGAATTLATEAATMLLGGGAATASKVAEGVAKGTARKLMQSAIKPSTADLMAGKATKAVETMLKEGVDATPGGIMKLRANIDDLSKQVDAAIDRYPMATVKKELVSKHMQGIFDKYSKQINPKADKATIQKVMDEFLDEWKGAIPLKLAQELKSGTYKTLGNKSYGMNLAPAAERDALKMGALGLKEGIEEVAPEVIPLNARLSELINAGNVALRRTMQDANKNPFGLTWLAENPAAALAFAAERNPWIKSSLAHYLYSGGAERNLGQAAGGILSGAAPSGIIAP